MSVATGSGWEKGFKDALVVCAWDRGDIVSEDANYYGWVDFDASQHIASCSLAQATDIREDHWESFEGTFVESTRTRYGMAMTVTCDCGEVTDRTLRWEEGLGKAIIRVVGEALKD